MALLTISYRSDVLEMERRVQVIYPDASSVTPEEATSQDVPVLYLLHGMAGNEDSWLKRTAIERLLRRTNLIVVMPSTDLGWYTNTTYGMRYYDSIANELPRVLKRFFPNMSTKREKTFIAGLSMGGYGAFKLALTTNRFSYAGSFSGALHLDLTHLGEDVTDQTAYWEGVFGSLADKDALASQQIIALADQSDKKTDLYAWCGQEDFLYTANNYAVSELQKKGFKIDYQTAHGKHEWYYWEKQLEVFLERLPITYVKEERLS
ncbi:alpha/beta hydrolase [Streptococcus sp. DD12]|uniref:alpha/beta hydrolase n=1 Tax=Streptococcus sp. DD12 TaxID=1777880 RepID=UPI00079A95FE|nr:alpha/beta hydrolase family protein [Streptococcus sp. DD12]KXT77004.1 Tributyrin esterase [Streptococcus sp. DD12]